MIAKYSSPDKIYTIVGLTFLQDKRQNARQDPHAVERLVKVNAVGRFDDLAELRHGLREESGQILKALVPQAPRGRGGQQFKDLLRRAGNLPELVPEFGVVRRHVHLNESGDALAELFLGGRLTHAGELGSYCRYQVVLLSSTVLG